MMQFIDRCKASRSKLRTLQIAECLADVQNNN